MAALMPLDCSGDTLPESQQVAAEAGGAHTVSSGIPRTRGQGRKSRVGREMFVLGNRNQNGRKGGHSLQ